MYTLHCIYDTSNVGYVGTWKVEAVSLDCAAEEERQRIPTTFVLHMGSMGIAQYSV